MSFKLFVGMRSGPAKCKRAAGLYIQPGWIAERVHIVKDDFSLPAR